MKSKIETPFLSILIKTTVFGLLATFAVESVAQESIQRLFKRADKIPGQTASNESCLVPSPIQTPTVVLPATYEAPVEMQVQIGDDAPTAPDPAFTQRDAQELQPQVFMPEPIGRQLMRRKAIQKKGQYAGEYVFDGNDAGKRVTVDGEWNVYGLGIEDTVGHFDTLDGRRLVSPSNRVAIYAPRFSSVRKVEDLGESYASTSPRQFEEEQPVLTSTGENMPSTTKQHEQVGINRATNRATSMIEETRGVVADSRLILFGVKNSFAPYENLEIMRFGKFSSAERARLDLGIQSANVWQDDLGLQVAVDDIQPVIVRDVNKIQQLETVESKDNAILRVVKVASHVAARPGDEVEFTIRFDNLSGRKIGNVTIIDNLTSRLEYVDGSAQSSHHAVFATKTNEAGSLELRWEIRDPLKAGEGGVVRFKCRVR